METPRADLDLQDVLVLNLSRAVQICVDLAAHLITDLPLPPPDTIGLASDYLEQGGILDAELALRMKKTVGFRNIAAHAYDTIDCNIMFAIATTHLGDFRAFARVMAGRLSESET